MTCGTGEGQSAADSVTPKVLLWLYRTMVTIRCVEEQLAAALTQGEIGCPVHLYTGQEAVAAGVCANLTDTDYVFGTHRSHGHYLAKGGSLLSLVAEIYGRQSGCARGRGGSMHLVDPDRRIFATPIVGSTIPNAVGAALAAERSGEGAVAVAFFGDGAVEEGRFAESLNLAALYQLPTVFVCENNFYASHLRLEARQRQTDIWQRAAAYGLPGVRVDGNDVCAVYREAARAVQRARCGSGPTLLECLTYRWRGHVGPNYDLDCGIREPAELAAWQALCPIERLGKALIAANLQTPQDLAAIREEVACFVAQAMEAAAASPPPSADELLSFVVAATDEE